ncbi:uncharacterized protein STEHIDRAFT_102256 [Stereum hirsutum FP-91666 SS1]|uniref:uncharacterized protein n=1 Tax=Stereum hirsutum (strain FP-91666) TaxID=721885 RepID=UPI000444A752|nr:uncharacterized protein STEHIDRAFT_102256 [Stereum hirsutum FP-91666 SS1]EIM82836.1 hypothetical protein STEHIDRAFT_102256 [Stereum hirsutum FP-91666 SS1]
MRTGYAFLLSLPGLASLISGLSSSSVTSAQAFVLQDVYVGDAFFKGFHWETMNDPTHGRVNYVSQSAARQANLSYASNDKFVMRADDTTKVWKRARGRDSVRISSKQTYDDALFVLDLEHMPEGCATWPAFWTVTKKGPWPHGGEIDVIEGVNLDTHNLASLHTLPGCTMAQHRPHTGTPTSLNCDTSQNYNQGCGVSFSSTPSPSSSSYGKAFNAARGGWYVMSKSASKGVQVWFWARDDAGVPPEIKNGGGTKPNEGSGGEGGGGGERKKEVKPEAWWGTPAATFPVDECDWKKHFDAHQVVFDLTFCGDWAGSVWSGSGCGAGTCEDYVDNNPSAFKNAYWEINSLAVYTADADGGGAQVPMVAGLLQGKLQGKTKSKSKGTGGKSKKGGRGE